MAENMTLAGNSEFKSWVLQLKKDIRHAQVKAAIKVNSGLQFGNNLLPNLEKIMGNKLLPN